MYKSPFQLSGWFGVTALTAIGTAAWLRTRRLVVNGNSMMPALFPGDHVLIVRTRRVRPGEVVAVLHPDDPGRLMVKRVAAVDRPSGTVTVVGDNRLASTDSRDFGPVPRRFVIGRAVYRYGAAGRDGMLRRVVPPNEPIGQRQGVDGGEAGCPG
jgi:nickel-type superoxide dismutase maturation protease